jgi:dTDP-4-dehydrorhamnose reductase
MKTTVLVTGGNGQLASCINAISNRYPTLHFIFVDKNSLDITDAINVSDFFKNIKIDWCINCAAYTAVDRAEVEQEAAQNVNVTGAKNLAQVCKKHDAKLVHISTDFVFDGKQNMAYTEYDATGPLNSYGKTKLQGELEIASILEQYFILRTSWLYSEFGQNFMLTMLNLSNEKKVLNVVDNQIGTPTYAGDLAQFIIELITTESVKFGTYNYSNEGVASWYDFAKAIFEINKVNINVVPIPSSDFPTLARRPTFSVLDKTKIKLVFNSRPMYWRDSLELCLEKPKKPTF